MIATPLFSIILPTFNRGGLLSVAIQSVIDQTYSNWELIIIDDGSTDNTKEAVESFILQDNRIQYLFQKHQERSVARNRGIEEAKGKFICFLDDDDYYLEHHLECFQQELQQIDSPLTILRTGFYRMKGEKKYPSDQYLESRDRHPVRFAAFHFCSACTLCVPKQFLYENSFPPAYRHWQDTHLILRLFAKFPFKQLPAYTYMYVHHENMGSRSIYMLVDAEERIQNNIDAIEDLFSKHGEQVNPFLPTGTRKRLISKKYLDHAHGALNAQQRILAWRLLTKSTESGGVYAMLWALSYMKFLLKNFAPKSYLEKLK